MQTIIAYIAGQKSTELSCKNRVRSCPTYLQFFGKKMAALNFLFFLFVLSPVALFLATVGCSSLPLFSSRNPTIRGLQETVFGSRFDWTFFSFLQLSRLPEFSPKQPKFSPLALSRSGNSGGRN